MAKQTPISAVNASSIVSSDSSVLRPGSKENTLATIDCIWMDVDPMVERITMNGMVSEEILCSVASGIMQLTRTELLWSGVTCETLASMTLSSMLIPQHFYEVAVKVHLASILSFTSCTIKATPTKPDTGARSTANIFASDGDRRASDDHITKGMNGIKSNTMLFLPRTKAYALMVFTAEEVYKFYPFTEEEISKILKILTWLTGLAPFDEIDFIKKVLVSASGAWQRAPVQFRRRSFRLLHRLPDEKESEGRCILHVEQRIISTDHIHCALAPSPRSLNTPGAPLSGCCCRSRRLGLIIPPT
ncbi:uncharacterized protein BJ171DRAFT_5853 [Polychytrium aggregatum]|uniref:uncharacterized protein n=1 Tax=Polychytrium aggregatum TaxID=110093 RepID=UPI0022FF3894|nr:uncharacterized protein BJ171DRAFT_5853 [Polychytrium aggregatum]KAI9209689.1 hypothetical protein BJ171DRAFT_5853 [Polychytrium aggregatum]